MNAKSVKVLEEVTAKSQPFLWKTIQNELAHGAKLLSAKKLATGSGRYEITFNDMNLGACRTVLSPRARSTRR
jgi:hypothetical protein